MTWIQHVKSVYAKNKSKPGFKYSDALKLGAKSWTKKAKKGKKKGGAIAVPKKKRKVKR